jgi:sigma-B regulation protein RsbU (phosphoserine phosphatase)
VIKLDQNTYSYDTDEENKHLKTRLDKLANQMSLVLRFTDFCTTLLNITDIEKASRIIIEHFSKLVGIKNMKFIRKDTEEGIYAYYIVKDKTIICKKISKAELGREGIFIFCKKIHTGNEKEAFISIPIKYEGENLAAMKFEGFEFMTLNETDKKMLELFTLLAGMKIKNSLLDAQAQRERLIINEQNSRIHKDLDYAEKIQNCLLIRGSMRYNNYEIFGNYIPAQYLGGDLYDAFDIDNDSTVFYFADVSGHGVGGALITVFLKQTVKELVQIAKGKNGVVNPSNILKNIQKRFKVLETNEEIYVGMMLGVVNRKSNIVTFANAGHNVEPMHIKVKDNELVTYELSGLPINNWFESQMYLDYDEINIEIHKGDSFIIISDGITEAKSENGNMLGIEAIKKILLEDKTLSLQKKCDQVFELVYKHAGRIQLKDDMALFGFTRN